jgi:H/ACA ribonucleoprotein complex subunit 4
LNLYLIKIVKSIGSYGDMMIKKNQHHQLPSDIKRIRMIKSHATSNPHYGKHPNDRSLNELFDAGVFFVDKPAGPTCHQIDAWIKDMLHKSKVGHAGTLDPNVTGVLPIGVGRATRGLHIISQTGKEYIGLMKFHKSISEKKIRDTLKKFEGKIDQLPPVRSAVKRVRRKRMIYYLDFLEMKGTDVLFRVGCEAGTYVRTLCVDIGKKLGCKAHLAELRRTRVGKITVDNLCTLHEMKDGYLFWTEDGNQDPLKQIVHPIESLVSFIPHIVIRDSAVDAICHGANLAIPGVVELDSNIQRNDLVAVMTLKEEVVGVGKAISSTEIIIEKDRGVCVNVEQVYMKKGTYPPIWKKH